MSSRRGLRRRSGTVVATAALALAAWPATPARAIVSTNTYDSPFGGININAFIGAEDWYALGYTGSRTVLANVEAGHIWDGHDVLTDNFTRAPDGTFVFGPRVSQYINDPSIGTPDQLFDWHATMVGHTLAGVGNYYGYVFQDASGTRYDFSYGYGIAPFSQLWSAAIATKWDPEPGSDFTGSFEISDQSFNYAYVTTMQTGVNGRRADVINSSWGYDDPDGSVTQTKIIDALAYANHQTVVIAAGNHDTGNPAVTGPASGFNSISVAALSSDTSNPYYGYVASFSNRGVNDFTNPKSLPGPHTVPASRVAVDIAAPGDNFTLAAYLGLTGGHTGNAVFNLDAATMASTDLFFLNMAGTSFASPVVAGSASLLVDAGYDRFNGGASVDGRVIKAVLLNSAHKLAGWDNGQAYDNKGVLRTTQALDPATGTGALDLHAAVQQYLGGTTDVPGESVTAAHVQTTGWDYAVSTPGFNSDYFLDGTIPAGTPLSVTLDWFVNRAFDPATGDATDLSFADLDLEVWRTLNGIPLQLIASSESAYSNVEHLYFPLPADGQYMLRVKYFGDAYSPDDPTFWTPETYALAWMTPEPSTPLLLLFVAAPALVAKRRRP